jgi:hypothetical protein
MDIQKATIEDLKNEIQRRREEETPVPRTNPDFSKVQELMDYVVKSGAKGYLLRNYQSRVFQEVVDAIYGMSFWIWFNDLPPAKE